MRILGLIILLLIFHAPVYATNQWYDDKGNVHFHSVCLNGGIQPGLIPVNQPPRCTVSGVVQKITFLLSAQVGVYQCGISGFWGGWNFSL